MSKAAQLTSDDGIMLDRILTFFERHPSALDWVILAGALGGAAMVPVVDAAVKKAAQGPNPPPPFPSPGNNWSWGDMLGQAAIRSPLGILSLLFDPTTKIELPNIAGVAIAGSFTTVAGIAAARLLLNTEGAAGAMAQVGSALTAVGGGK